VAAENILETGDSEKFPLSRNRDAGAAPVSLSPVNDTQFIDMQVP